MGKCKAYCKHGGERCNHPNSIGDYCLMHHFKAKEDPEKWEKLQKRLKKQEKL